MSQLILNKNAATPSTPAVNKAKIYIDNTAIPQLKMVDENGTVITQVDNANTVTMTNKTLTAPTLTGHPTIEGVTTTGATGTGNMVCATSPTLTTPNIGAATGASLAVTGALTSSSPSAGIGYAAGAGAAVTQATSRSTGVTINALCGQITGNSTSLAAVTEALFTVTNNQVGLQDVVVVSVQSGPTASTSVFAVARVAAGAFDIRIRNLNPVTADTGAPIINFIVLKAVKA